jgi:hypothetical protein
LSIKDARDVVVLAVGTAYLQAVASAARVETARAQLGSESVWNFSANIRSPCRCPFGTGTHGHSWCIRGRRSKAPSRAGVTPRSPKLVPVSTILRVPFETGDCIRSTSRSKSNGVRILLGRMNRRHRRHTDSIMPPLKTRGPS